VEGQLVYVGMGRRLLAFVADWVAFVAFRVVIHVTLPIQDEDAEWRLALILWLAYMVLTLYFAHTTIGKYLFNIEVRSTRPGRIYPRISDLAMRETVFRWISMILLIGYIPAFYDQRYRAATDKWANTVVVRRAGKPGMLTKGALIAFGLLILIAFGFVYAPS